MVFSFHVSLTLRFVFLPNKIEVIVSIGSIPVQLCSITPGLYKEASEKRRVEKGYLHCSADVTNLG